jgi:hypothetical protein
MSTDFTGPRSTDENSIAPCPSCGAALPPTAVLCIACGYHLKLERHLATAVEQELPRPIDPNPFAPSADIEPQAESPHVGEHIADLTDVGARKAKAIVEEADNVYWTIVFAWCCCAPAWLVMLPWYGWRLWSWYQLNTQFHELRHPYGFSPHGELAGAFQDCKIKLWVGVIAGAIFWALVIFYTVVDAMRMVMDR